MTKLIAQTAAPASPAGFPPSMIIVWLLFIAGFYFLFIAPQRKKQKQQDKMLSALQSGDEVVTTGGIYGVITNVKDDRFVIRVGDNTKVEVGKGFILSVVKKPAAEEKKSS
jgi:preprotein translocase subunit YajC